MSIKAKILIAGLIQAVLILFLCIFVYLSFDNVISRLRTIEKMDDLYISLLEMRKAEKNYFLYKNVESIHDFAQISEEKYELLKTSRDFIVPNLEKSGRERYDLLLNLVGKYLGSIPQAQQTQSIGPGEERSIRDMGHEINNIADSLLKEERANVSAIINQNVSKLIASLGFIFLIQITLWIYFFHFIFKELGIMGNMITMVSQGRIHEVAGQRIIPKNELEEAIRAIADMARELEKRENELLQTGRLASLGVLVSGVAHELGNPLNNISMMAQAYVSLFDYMSDEEKLNFMNDVLNQTERIKKIVENLLDFSRQKKQELQLCQVGEIVQRSLQFVSNQLEISQIKTEVSIASDLPAVRMDPSQIEQVLVNLFINANQAMQANDRLFVDVYHDRSDRTVTIKITDTGSGIKKEDLPYIFDPFFTTKDSQGTGLGLAMSYGIIRQHHGDITVESEEGMGTTFIIKLPYEYTEDIIYGEENHRN
jgi:two-component system, NtrC family, sensor kinase